MSSLWQRLVGIFKRNLAKADGDATDVSTTGQDPDLAQREQTATRIQALKDKRGNGIQLTKGPPSRDDGISGDDPHAS